MKVCQVILFCGYVESNHLAGLPFRHDIGFDTADEALGDLAKALQKALKKGWPEPRRCPHCLNALSKPQEITGEDLREFVIELAGQNLDQAGVIYSDLEEQGWILGEFDLALPTVCIQQRGEYAISDRIFKSEKEEWWKWWHDAQVTEGIALIASEETPPPG